VDEPKEAKPTEVKPKESKYKEVIPRKVSFKDEMEENRPMYRPKQKNANKEKQKQN